MSTQGLLEHIHHEHLLISGKDQNIIDILDHLRQGDDWDWRKWSSPQEWYKWHMSLHAQPGSRARKCDHTHGGIV